MFDTLEMTKASSWHRVKGISSEKKKKEIFDSDIDGLATMGEEITGKCK